MFLIYVLLSVALTAQTIKHSKSDDLLNQLQGNNWDVYMIYFYKHSELDDDNLTTNNMIASQLEQLLELPQYKNANQVKYAKVDVADDSYEKLATMVGITVTPSILLMINGKGMWLSGANVPLLMERVNEFLPDYIVASKDRKWPEYAGFQ